MQQLWRWAAQGRIDHPDIDQLGRDLGLLPDRQRWSQFIDRALLGGGALALGLGLIFLIAANWEALGLWLRFGVAQLAVLAGVAAYWRWGNARAGRAGLGFSFMALGALMALFGQTYQTGVDPYHLFANWALLSLPWVWLARHSVLWLAWLLLVDIALLRWMNYRANWWGFFGTTEWLAWALVGVHGLGLLVVEFGERFGFRPGRRDWLRMSLWLVLLGAVTWLALTVVFESHSLTLPWLAALGYLATAAGGYWLMRRHQRSILGLAALCASAIAVIISLVARAMDDNDVIGNFLFLSTLVTALTAAAGYWLIQVHRSER